MSDHGLVNTSFSVVIPARNESDLLPACLESLNRQTYHGRYEIIVVDNGSSDNTADIARDLGASVVFEAQRGVCAARQAGFLAAANDVVISTDADSTFEPDWLARIDGAFRSKDGTVAVGGSVKFADAPIWARLYPKLLFGVDKIVSRLRGRPFYMSGCNLAFKRDAFSGYNVNLTQGGDEFYVLRQLKAKGPVVFDPSICVSTSARRLRKGLLYSLFVTLIGYYLFDYLWGRTTGKSLLGSFPEFRESSLRRAGWVRRVVVATSLMFVFVVIPPANAFARSSVRLVHNSIKGIDSR